MQFKFKVPVGAPDKYTMNLALSMIGAKNVVMVTSEKYVYVSGEIQEHSVVLAMAGMATSATCLIGTTEGSAFVNMLASLLVVNFDVEVAKEYCNVCADASIQQFDDEEEE